jgi:hypothetical protein|tara:strand:- start:51 stop:578 length:528 start_codon:yes stop_codon:yes gene_type:complete
MSTLKVNSIIPVSGVGTDSTTLKNGGGITQIKQVQKTNTFSTTSSSFTDVTGLSVSITPTVNTNKILVLVETNSSTTGGNNAVFRLMRDSTPIAIGDNDSNRPAASFQQRINDTNAAMNASINFLDSPATTSEVTYKVQTFSQSSGVHINKTFSDTDSTVIARTFSSITVMEVSA